MPDLVMFRPRQLTRWQRLAQTVRSYTLAPLSAKSKELADRWSSGSARSGVIVNEQTALNYSAVWAAVNIVSGGVSSVPLALYKVVGDGKTKEEFKSHPTYRILHDQPNPQMGSMVFRRTLQAHAMVWGNGFAEIVRDEANRPRELWPLLPYAVQPYVESGVLRYRCFNPNGTVVILDAANILHIRGLSNDGICGYPTIGSARESIGLGMAAEQFGSTFFGNGSTFGGIIKYPQGLRVDPQTKKDNEAALNKNHQGPDKAHKLLAIYEGADYQALGVPPNAAQFLETRQFQIEEVCRWFNVAPHKLHHLLRTSYNMIEHSAIEFDMDTLNPWWVIWEQELQMKLVSPLEQNQQRIEHVRQGRLQADVASRGTFYQTSFNVGAVTPNEIRGLENRNPIAGGDQAFVMNSLIPLELATEYWKAEIEAKKQKAEPPPPPPPPAPAPSNEEEVKAVQEQLLLARKATQLAEDRADRADAQRQTAEAALAARDEALKDEQELRATEEQAHQEELADVQRARDVAEALAVELVRERDEARGTLAERDATIVALQAEGARLMTALSDVEADRDGWAARVALMGDVLAPVEAERDEARRLLDLEARISADWQRKFDASESERVSVTQQRDRALAEAATVREERDMAVTRASEHERTVAETTAERDEARASLEAVHVELQAAKEWGQAVTEATHEAQAEAETLRADLARARADIAAELDAQRTLKTVVLSSMRSLFVEATERLLQKESDRARKQQATPEKFRHWLETFYPLHAETVRATFRPLVGPWTAVAGGAPSLLLERLVEAHMQRSVTDLRLVLDGADDDDRAALFERTLRRWEQERAEVMADALVQEGMAQR